MARNDLFFRIRLPEALKADIQLLAKANHRSANQEIVARLAESIALGLNGTGVTADAALQSVDETEQGGDDTFMERLAKIDAHKRKLMLDGLQEVIGLLDKKSPPAAAAPSSKPKGKTVAKKK